MLTGRRWGGTAARSSPPSSTRPWSGVSNPARMRSRVVLPQPDGPSSAKNSPGKMSRLSRFTAGVPAKRLETAAKRTSGSPAASGPGLGRRLSCDVARSIGYLDAGRPRKVQSEFRPADRWPRRRTDDAKLRIWHPWSVPCRPPAEMEHHMEFQDRAVVVTGGTGALGAAVVGALLEA